MGTALKMPFNEAQIEILKLFTGNLTESQLQELRQVLIAFKFKLLDAHIESVSAEKGLSDADIEKISLGHRRTPYKRRQQADKTSQA